MGFLPDEGRCDTVMDDLAGFAVSAGSEGVLCRLTTLEAGVLELRLTLYAVDAGQQITCEAGAQATFAVE